MFYCISKRLEVRQTTTLCAAFHDVWKCDKTRSFVLNMLLQIHEKQPRHLILRKRTFSSNFLAIHLFSIFMLASPEYKSKTLNKISKSRLYDYFLRLI